LLGYSLMTTLFPLAMTGRVNTALNLLVFAFAFCFQWGTGAVLGLFPVGGGRYAPEGYATAFGLLVLMQLATLAWLVCARQK